MGMGLFRRPRPSLAGDESQTIAKDLRVRDVVDMLLSKGWIRLEHTHESVYPYVQLQDTRGSGRIITVLGADDDYISPTALRLIFRDVA